MSNTSKHHRLSVATRNVQVITQVNNGATSAELAEEYHVTWETIRDSIRDKHYQVVKNPRNERRYQEFLAKVRANNAAAANSEGTVDTNTDADTSMSSSKDNEKEPHTTIVAASNNKKTVYLVETGYILHTTFETMLSMDNGTAVFMIPRFCVNELKRMASKPVGDPVKSKAENALWKMFDENVWQKRIIPFEPLEEGMIVKTADTRGYTSRSFGIAEAALELYISGNYRVHVLTNAMEIQHLVHRVIQEENLSSDLAVTRVYTN